MVFSDAAAARRFRIAARQTDAEYGPPRRATYAAAMHHHIATPAMPFDHHQPPVRRRFRSIRPPISDVARPLR